MNDKWLGQQERSNLFLIKLIRAIASRTGRRFTRMFLPIITLYFFLTSRSTRQASRSYWLRVSGEKAGAWQVFGHIYWFAATVLDRVFFVTEQFEYFDIRILNQNVVDDIIEKYGKCILLGSHVGSFEVLRALVVKNRSVPLKILMYRGHNEMVTSVLESLNADIADTVIDLGDENAIFNIQEATDQGYSIGMLGDRDTGNERLVRCQLLGGDVELPAGPFLLASILKLPVVMFYGLYRGGNRYDICFDLLGERISINRKQREQDVTEIVARYVASIEKYVRIEPKNWFNFYDYWHEQG
ncbi:MAG TPA: lipid A biosynthesis acyltransferase [Gammaproteobacteria bacterium]|nr:lipid A biosynthesis acyltransferase [Gammaproteobacteria bacterium]